VYNKHYHPLTNELEAAYILLLGGMCFIVRNTTRSSIKHTAKVLNQVATRQRKEHVHQSI